MISKDFFQALRDLEEEKGISGDTFISALETALTSAYKRNYGEAKNAKVKIVPEKNTIKIYSYKTIVEKPEEVEDADKQITLAEAKEIKSSYKVGDVVEQEENPKNFGRIAVLTARQVILQKLREIQLGKTMDELSEKEDELVTSVVTRIDGPNVFVQLGTNQIEAVLNENDQIPGEKYYVGQHLKVYVKKLKDTTKVTMVQVSRANVGFIKKLFELEIPEIASGEVVINSVSREAGYRTKIAVSTSNPNIDPIGACVGDKGGRINAIISEINGEKIDIIEFSDDLATFIGRALSPAPVETVDIVGDGQALAVVPDDKLSLAIGKKGQNVRLAARLTHCKIDVKSHSAIEQASVETTEQSSTIHTDETVSLDDMFKDDDNK